MKRKFEFYIIPTPIGNITDITLRAIEVMKTVDLIACEDMRVTQKLLNHYEIKTKCISYHKFNEKERVEFMLNTINEGKSIALVSDAGTPMICDPGNVLLPILRENNIEVTSLAGASTVTTFLSQVPRDSECFSFIGFLPKTHEKIQSIFQKYNFCDLVFFESPNRILKTLEEIKLFSKDAKVAVGRELTKLFEEVLIDNVDNLIKHFTETDPRGEFCVMLYSSVQNEDEAETLNKIAKLKSKGFKSKEIATILSELFNLNKNEVYKLSL